MVCSWQLLPTAELAGLHATSPLALLRVVLEFEAVTGKLIITDNPAGVLTNEPQILEQRQLLEAYKASVKVWGIHQGVEPVNLS